MVDIFGTLGPSCDNEEILYKMYAEGMTGIRINLSHVKLADCAASIDRIKRAADKFGITPKLLIDMQGPELRIGSLDKPLDLREGEFAYLTDIAGADESRRYENIIPVASVVVTHLEPGKEVLLDDGKILLEIIEKSREQAKAKIIRGGILSGRKSIAIVGESIEMPALTEDDLVNIKDACKYGVTGVMQPFVRSKEDLISLRKELDDNSGQEIKIYAKIENLAGVENLESFFPYADEIIIARGDLGNAMPLWELPRVQKDIAGICRKNDMPFMVVTQMLSSMEHSKVPTRAEVSDIYNAVLDGAGSVMVTGETAVGENPVEVIKYLSKTAGAVNR